MNKISLKEKEMVVGRIVLFLQTRNKSITLADEDWKSVGTALKSEFGDCGKYLFQRFSDRDKHRKPGEIESMYEILSADPAYNIGTIVMLAMQQNFPIRNLTIRTKTWVMNAVAHTLLSLQKTRIRHNTVKGIIEYSEGGNGWSKVNDSDLCHIYMNLLENLFNKNTTADWLYAQSPKWNPAKAFLDSLPEDDGIDYISELAATIKTKHSDILKLLLRKWLIGFVGSLKDHGTYNENILVLQGSQGIGKTRWVRKLIPEKWREYQMLSNIDPNSKDHFISLSENFMIYMDELDSIVNKKASIEAFKALTSMDKVTVRRPYDRFSTDSPRLASFVGSINNNEFLKDPTGNRRFFVLGVEAIDHVHSVNMLCVYRQALVAYENKESHYLNEDEIRLVTKHNEAFESTNLYDELINKHLLPGSEERMSTVEIIQYINENESINGCPPPLNLNMASYAGQRLTKLGFRQELKKVNGKTKRVYGVSFVKQSLNDTDIIRDKNESMLFFQ